jgi:hypothetical protein
MFPLCRQEEGNIDRDPSFICSEALASHRARGHHDGELSVAELLLLEFPGS